MADQQQKVQTIQDTVLELLNNQAGQKVKDAVVAELVDEEIKKFTAATRTVITLYNKKKTERKEILSKGTYAYNASYDKINSEPTYTQEQIGKLRKLDSEMEEIEKAAIMALEGNNFEKLLKLAQQQQQGRQGDEKDKKEAA